MSVTGLLRQMTNGAERDLPAEVFQALMAEDSSELADVAERVADSGRYPEDFVHALEALAGWRAHYYDKTLNLSPAQRAQVEDWDDEWTVRLVQQLRYF